MKDVFRKEKQRFKGCFSKKERLFLVFLKNFEEGDMVLLKGSRLNRLEIISDLILKEKGSLDV
jgi:UDP-N-acetylmuramyl pentapeptide synthase